MKQKFVLTINKNYLIKTKFFNQQINNKIEFDSFEEMRNFQNGMYYGVNLTENYILGDLMDFEIIDQIDNKIEEEK